MKLLGPQSVAMVSLFLTTAACQRTVVSPAAPTTHQECRMVLIFPKGHTSLGAAQRLAVDRLAKIAISRGAILAETAPTPIGQDERLIEQRQREVITLLKEYESAGLKSVGGFGLQDAPQSHDMILDACS